MATGPNLDIYSPTSKEENKKLERLFKPPEFFAFTWALSHSMGNMSKIKVPAAQPYIQAFKKLSDTTAADANAMDGYFLSYCDTCASLSKWVNMGSGTDKGWKVNPKDYYRPMRIFLSRFIFHNSAISQELGARDYYYIFRLLKKCLQDDLETLKAVEDKTYRRSLGNRLWVTAFWPLRWLLRRMLPKSLYKCTSKDNLLAQAKVDRLVFYLQQAMEENQIFTFDPPQEQITKKIDLGDGTSLGLDNQGGVYWG